MLSEIHCNLFAKKTITFNKGLNVVLGTNEGDNSVGKSTLLLIIDFAFGGDTYAKSEDIKKNVEKHDICFKFVFNNDEYFFSRSTFESDRVFKCDKEYNKIEALSLTNFKAWLDEKYKLQLYGLSFRDCVSRFMRIYGKGNYDERYPLRSNSNTNKKKEDVITCIKIFDMYTEIQEAEEQAKIAKKRSDALKSAKDFNLVSKIGKRQYDENVKQIRELRGSIEGLSHDLENNFLDIDSEKTDEIITAKRSLSKLRRTRYSILNKIKNLKDNEEYSFSKTTRDLEALKTFFPHADFNKISEIEAFHKKISRVFKKQVREEINILQNELCALDDSIKCLEDKISQLTNNKKLSVAVLQKHADLVNQIGKLEKENEQFLEEKTITEDKKEKQDSFIEKTKSQLTIIEQDINKTMEAINSNVFYKNSYPPTISFTDTSYTFQTPNDTGTGAAYKGLIVFDLAIAFLTRIPVLIHDSILLKQISNTTLLNILKEYLKCNKQVFIAFDKQDTYGDDARQLLEANSVIKLTHNGGELFGRYWGESKNL